MFSTMNLALLAAGVLLLVLLMKLRKDQAAKGGAPKASKKAPGRTALKAPKAGRRIAAPKRGGGRQMGRGRGRGRQPEPVAYEPQPAETAQQAYAPAPQVGAYPADPSMIPAAAAAPPMPGVVPAPQTGVGWQPAPVVAQPGWPTAPEQAQWVAPGSDGLGYSQGQPAYAQGQPAYADPGATGVFPTVGGPLADPGAAAAMVTNGNGAFPGVPSAPPAEWSMPAPDANAAWPAPQPAAPHQASPAPYAEAAPAQPQEWASWAPQGETGLGSPVPDSVPEQWSQPAAPEVPAYENALPALDAEWVQSAPTAPVDATASLAAEAVYAPQAPTPEWVQAPAPAFAQGVDSEVIYDDFGFPIEDAAALAPAAHVPMAPAPPVYEAPAPVEEPALAPSYTAAPAPSAAIPEIEWDVPAAPAPMVAPVDDIPAIRVDPPAAVPVAEWAPVEVPPVDVLAVAPSVDEILPDTPPAPVHAPQVTQVAAPAISVLHREAVPELTASAPSTDDAWWDETPPVVVAPSQQTGRFALGGHAIRAGQEALTGVTFREARVDEDWTTPSDANRAARIELTIEGSVNCSAGGIEVVADPGFAPTEDGFTVRLVAENSGPFMASGRYRVI